VGEKLPIDVIAAYLRLGKKFEITQLRQEALDILSFEFPSCLQAFDTRPEFSFTRIDTRDLMTLVPIINLARETGTHAILPVAYYLYCRYHGVRPILHSMRGKTSNDSAYFRLSDEDQRAILFGWHTLIERESDYTFCWMMDLSSSESCETPHNSSCNDSIYAAYYYEFAGDTLSVRALRKWESVWGERLCNGCATFYEAVHNEGRNKIWDELPSIFGFPGWDELLKQ
jgi:hypothetical protein